MPLPNPSLAFSETERALGERLRKLAAETDQIEGYQYAHAERLAQLAEAVGMRLGMHGADLTSLKFAALAHDLGERKLKREYLRRPSKLNWEEQLDLWRHPVLGEQEALNLKLSREVQLLVRWHHEAWNGMGYPDGLAAIAIPLGARILRAVDTWCALTSDRPYRGAYNAEAAEQKLLEQTGLECDPRVVKVLLAVLAEERAMADLPYRSNAPHSYETVPMEIVKVEEYVSETASTSVEMPLTEDEKSESPQPVTPAAPEIFITEMTSEVELPETVPDLPAASVIEPVAEAKPENLPEKKSSAISFDAPTLQPFGERPAPPTPPPAPMWPRLQPQPLSSTVSPDNILSDEKSGLLYDGPDAEPLSEVVPSGLAPTEEVPVLDLAALNESRVRSNTLGLGSFLPEPVPLRAAPISPVTPAKLQVVTLSEVPDHFWLVAKWIYEEWWETPDNSINIVSNLLKEHLASTTVPQTFVALLDGQPVGSISLIENDLPEYGKPITPWLNWLYVLPAQRRQGIGSRLLEGAFTRAKLQGAETIHVAAPATHEGFFTRHGWKVVEREIGPQRLSLMARHSTAQLHQEEDRS